MRCVSAVLMVLALAACSSKETLVVYSPHGPEVLGDYEKKFEAVHPGVDVQCLDMGSNDVLTRVRAERNRPAADVWWGGSAALFVQAANDGLLASYKPTWAASIEPGFKDAQDRWYATYRSPLAILFNTRHYTRQTAPQTWDDLVAPAWNKKITLRKPLASGTMRTFVDAMILRAPDEAAGFAWLKRLHEATESYNENPQLLFDHIKRNEDLVTVWLMSDVVLQRERNGYPFDFVLPPQTPEVTEGIAIVANAPHRTLAEQFYEFVTSPESLADQAKAYAKVPARTDLPAGSLPDWMAGLAIDRMRVDERTVAAREAEWMRCWEQEVYSAR